MTGSFSWFMWSHWNIFCGLKLLVKFGSCSWERKWLPSSFKGSVAAEAKRTVAVRTASLTAEWEEKLQDYKNSHYWLGQLIEAGPLMQCPAFYKNYLKRCGYDSTKTHFKSTVTCKCKTWLNPWSHVTSVSSSKGTFCSWMNEPGVH